MTPKLKITTWRYRYVALTTLILGPAAMILADNPVNHSSSRISKSSQDISTAHCCQSGQAGVIFFCSEDKIGLIHPDGSCESYMVFPRDDQLGWQVLNVLDLTNGRIVFWSKEKAVDPQSGFYEKTGLKYARTHLWWCDWKNRKFQEIALPTLTWIPAMLPDGKRLLVTGEESADNNNSRIYTVHLDGGEKADFHELPGFAYGFSLSPNGEKVAYHLTKGGYKVYVMDLATGVETLLAGEEEYLNFGTSWSPDGQWILYQRCLYAGDPMHSRSDVCIVKADGSEKRILTEGQRQWFGTSFGPKEKPGSGSIFPKWSPDGRWITYCRCSDGARTAWVYNKNRSDTDHFNCEYLPEQAKGGSQLCLIEIPSGRIVEITPLIEKEWIWKAEWSPDSRYIGYNRAVVGQNPEIWIVGIDGFPSQFLTKGIQAKGASIAMWITLPF